MPAQRWFCCLILVALVFYAGCGDDDDNDNDDQPVDDDSSPIDDDSTADDDATPLDDDTIDDDTSPDDDSTPDDDTTPDDDDTTPVDVLDYVDPFVGTGGIGYGVGSAYPGPKAPFGLMSLSPDTTLQGMNFGFDHCAGYNYPDTQIRGFSHTHLYGTGAVDLGALLVMPMLEAPDAPFSEKDYRSKYRHSDEQASPGYYSVLLADTGILAELTATDTSGMHRYTYPDKAPRYVIVNPTHYIDASEVTDATVLIDQENQTIEGQLRFHGGLSGRFGGVMTYWAMEFADPFTEYGTWKDGTPNPENTSESGTDIGAYVGFAAAQKEPLVFKVGLSFQSIEQAYANLYAQIPDFDFDAVREQTHQRWSELINMVEVTGGTEEQLRIFYTALYHSHLMPTDWTETNNRYFGFDLASHDAGARRYYTDMSLWDTFRTLHPLYNLLEPQVASDMMQSLTWMYEQGGSIPKWPMGNGYTGCMIGTPADIVLAEAYLKGIDDFDFETAYEGCYAHATGPVPNDGRENIEDYLTMGYICEDHNNAGVSLTTEATYADASLSKWAAAMGLTDDAEMFLEHSHNWQNHFDPETHFLRPKLCDGSWFEPFIPWYVFDEHYTEGDAWHWSFYVPHDVPGLIAMYDNEAAFIEKLTTFFQKAVDGYQGILLPNVYYWHGNEPDIFSAYMFNYTSRPDLAQKYVRWVMETKYHDGPAGIPGNDDGGTMSSWYIFSALGFFPLAGSDEYLIGSPIFDSATLHLPGGNLVITVENNSAENMYVQSATLNEEPLAAPFFTHDQIVNGGMLHFVMGPEPAKWGR